MTSKFKCEGILQGILQGILNRVTYCLLPLMLGSAIVFTGTMEAAIPLAEREALINIYKALNGDNWRNNSGWKSEPFAVDDFGPEGSEGTWKGVRVTGNHVTAISFSGNLLTGSIPSEIRELEYLESLMLIDKGLTGEIPPELGELQNLKELRLMGDFSGSIPGLLGDLVNLKVLHLGKRLTGEIPQGIGKLVNLESMILDGKFTGDIPMQMGQLTKLTSLKLSGNFSGNISPQLGNLKNLKLLSIVNKLSQSEGDGTGSIPAELGQLGKLEELRLKVGLTGAIPPELGNLTSLKRLILSGNELSGEIPVELEKLTWLEYLALDRNRLSGIIPQELGSLINLKKLLLHYNHLSGAIPMELGNLVRLRQLRLDGNQMAGDIPTNLTNLTAYLVNIGYNQLDSTDLTVQRFFNKLDLGWRKSQTLPPTEFIAEPSGEKAITVSWKPIEYQSGPGGYQLYYSTSPGGPWTLVIQTRTKQVKSYEIDKLRKGATYYFILRTLSNPHSMNKNPLVSPYTPEFEATMQ